MERAKRIPETLAWTRDGYCRDQNALGAYRYRTIPASINACGPVAVYNLLHYDAQTAELPEVIAELDALHRLRVPGPTQHRILRRYLERRIPGAQEVHGRAAALAAAAHSRMGVYRYREGQTPHYVAYVRAGGGYRFFNVSDALEDGVLSMERFGAEHLHGGPVKLLYWN
ncbi:MAG: hypothetical protein K6G54_01790 [Oscillospiraceae bacterium]|nr:hypothetical protein [Oscillospiraceae bacterium]